MNSLLKNDEQGQSHVRLMCICNGREGGDERVSPRVTRGGDKQETERWNSGQLARHTPGNQYYITLFTRLPSLICTSLCTCHCLILSGSVGFIHNLFFKVLFFFFLYLFKDFKQQPARQEQITNRPCCTVVELWYCRSCTQSEIMSYFLLGSYQTNLWTSVMFSVVPHHLATAVLQIQEQQHNLLKIYNILK